MSDDDYGAVRLPDGRVKLRTEDFERLQRDAAAAPPPFESMVRKRRAAGAEREREPDRRPPWLAVFDRPQR